MTSKLSALQDWVDEVADHTQPNEIHWCNGSDAEFRRRVSSDEHAEDVLFNYLGILSQEVSTTGLVRSVRSLSTSVRAPENGRSHLLEVNSYRDGALKMDWIYNTRVHRRNTIEKWATQYLAELRSIILHCTSRDSPDYTPSDFPEAEMSQEDLDEFLEQL